MELTPQAIRAVEFREKLRGYHPEDVDAFVEQVALGVDQLQRQLRQLSQPSAAGEEDISEDVIRRTLVMAQRTADMVLSEAKESADKIVADARSEADHVLSTAQAEADRTAGEARQILEGDLAGLRVARDELEADVTALQGYGDRQRARLREALLEQLQAIESGGIGLDEPPALRQESTTSGGEPGLPSALSPADPVALTPSGPMVDGGGHDFEPPATGDAEPTADQQGEYRPADGIDMVARARDLASMVPGQGEDDPFLDELRRAVHDDKAPGREAVPAASAPPQDEQPRPSDEPAIEAAPTDQGEGEQNDELRDIPEGGRISGRLFRRR